MWHANHHILNNNNRRTTNIIDQDCISRNRKMYFLNSNNVQFAMCVKFPWTIWKIFASMYHWCYNITPSSSAFQDANLQISCNDIETGNIKNELVKRFIQRNKILESITNNENDANQTISSMPTHSFELLFNPYIHKHLNWKCSKFKNSCSN